jgi:hypothetical protein
MKRCEQEAWNRMTSFQIELCDTLPPRDALDGILGQYYDLIVVRMRDMGFEIDPDAPKSALAEFWANSDDYLPPKGCLVGSGPIDFRVGA